MDDRKELDRYRHAPLLQETLAAFSEILLPVYLEADQAALRHQKDHRRLTLVSVSCGTVAVLLAIVQLVFAQLTSMRAEHVLPVKVGELLAVILGTASVGLGLWAAKQNFWLCERHKAERCRLLKFHFLTQETLWHDGFSCFAAWRQSLLRETEKIHAIDRPAVEAWADRDTLSDPPLPLSRCVLAVEELRALAAYYIEKRVAFQSRFFEKRSSQYRRRDRILRLLAPACFFVSVTCVLVHSLLDFLYGGTEPAHRVGLWFFLLAASLPVVGWGIRTYRSAHEFARSASLFHAKHHNLENLKQEIERADPGNPNALKRLLWKGEDYLEREHREWLWLMMEAEWYG